METAGQSQGLTNNYSNISCTYVVLLLNLGIDLSSKVSNSFISSIRSRNNRRGKMDLNDVLKDIITKGLQSAINELKLVSPNQFMTPKQVVKALGGEIDEATVRRWCRNGDLVGHQFGKFVRISVEDFNEFCKKRRLTT